VQGYDPACSVSPNRLACLFLKNRVKGLCPLGAGENLPNPDPKNRVQGYDPAKDQFYQCRGLVISRFANIGLQTLLPGGQALLPAFSAYHSLICFCCSADSTVEAQDRNRWPPSSLRPNRKMFCCETLLNLMVLEA